MKYNYKMLKVFVIGFCLGSPSLARGAFEFTERGARSASLAGAYTAVSDDAEAIWWNPGGLRLVNSIRIDSSYTNLYGLSDLNQINFSFILPTLSLGSWGLGYSSFGSSDYKETDIRLGFAAGLGPGVFFGTNLKSNSVSIDGGDESGGAFAMDTGLVGNITPDYTLGISVYNINRPSMASNPTEYLQQRLMMGLSATPVESVALSLDMHKVKDKDWEERIGLEFPVSSVFRMRAGIQTRPSRFSFGFGVDWGIFTLNYANLSHSTLDTQHLFSFQANFASEETSRTQAVIAEPSGSDIEEPEILVNLNTVPERELPAAGMNRTLLNRLRESAVLE